MPNYFGFIAIFIIITLHESDCTALALIRT